MDILRAAVNRFWARLFGCRFHFARTIGPAANPAAPRVAQAAITSDCPGNEIDAGCHERECKILKMIYVWFAERMLLTAVDAVESSVSSHGKRFTARVTF
jgi:hypothetical protein